MNVIRKFINEGGKGRVFITFHGKLNLPFHISHRHFTFHEKKNVLHKQIFKLRLLTATAVCNKETHQNRYIGKSLATF